MLVDTHCHLGYDEYSNFDDIFCDISKSDVKIMIASGYDYKSSSNAVALAHKYNNIYATVGFGPDECELVKEEDFLSLEKWLIDEKVVGVGEIGLDYYHDDTNKDKQKEAFIRQIRIAKKYSKPIVVHNREASSDVYEILSKEKVKGVLHCFNDSYEMALKFIELGFYLGIGGIITFKKNNLISVINKLSLDNIVLETDSPYLTPEPYRGKKNNPSYLSFVAAAISKIKDLTYDEVKSKTTSNACKIFDFNNKI